MEFHKASNLAVHRAKERGRVQYVVREDVGDYRVCEQDELEGYFEGCMIMHYVEPNFEDGPAVYLHNADGSRFHG